MLNLPSHIGVTASLTINFKSPCQADQVSSHQISCSNYIRRREMRTMSVWLMYQFVIVRTKLDKVSGRKATVSGTMETLDGEKVADAT